MDKKEHLKGHSAIQERDYRQRNPVVLLSALLSVVAVVAMVALPSQAASARNTYAEVNSSTPGVTHIYSIEDDFYVTTRQVSAPSFRADIDLTACHPYQMTSPRNGHVCLGIGGSSPYMVRDESGGEDTGHGIVQVLKLDIEQSTVRIGWNANSCSLNLTSDSVPGGQAVWSSSPAGIAGCGRSVSFNPSSLEPGEYVVTAKSSLIDDYYDTCVVKIVRITLDGFNPAHTWARGRYCSVECHQTQCRAEVEPEGETGITYSIVDDPCGAVIDSNTGVVTPGLTSADSSPSERRQLLLPNAMMKMFL
ncbi:MAG: hypothetical protein E7049_07665 [Lentisphaerae bacterium]|jgi:hypothetical protein|nr:hypothetical protein [Lentisphaerota bacterium]